MVETKDFSCDVQIQYGKAEDHVRNFRMDVRLCSIKDGDLRKDNIKLVRAICSRNKNDRVKDIHNYKQVRGAAACVYLEDSYQPDIEAAVRSLAKKGASAVLVTRDPGLSVDIPVFVIPRNVMTEIYQNLSKESNLSFRLEERISVASDISTRDTLHAPTCVVSTHIEIQKFDISITGHHRDGKIDSMAFESASKMRPLDAAACMSLNGVNLMRALWNEDTFVNKDKIKDSILYVCEADIDVIQNVARESASNGALALFVPIDPEESFDIPVFVLQAQILQTFSQFHQGCVDLKPSRSHSQAKESFPHLTVTEKRALPEKCDVQVARDGLEKPDNKQKSFASVITSGVKKLKRTVQSIGYKSTTFSRLKAILEQEKNWSDTENYALFKVAVDLVKKAKNTEHHSHTELMGLSNLVAEKLEQFSTDMMFLAFAMYLQLCCESVEEEKEFTKFRICLAEAILSIHVDPASEIGSGFHAKLQRTDTSILTVKPCEIMYHYLVTRMKRWAKKRSINDSFLLGIVWITKHHCGRLIDWKDLEPYVYIKPEDLNTSTNCVLALLLGEISFRSLAISTQPNIDKFCLVVRQFYEVSVTRVGVFFSVGNRLKTLLREWYIDRIDIERIIEVLDLLDILHETNPYVWKRGLVSDIISQCGEGSFVKIIRILKAVDVEHSYYSIFHSEIVKSLSIVFTRQEVWQSRAYYLPSIIEVRTAIKDPSSGKIMGSKDMVSSIDTYLHYIAGKKTPTETKLSLIEEAYSNWIIVGDVDDEDAFMRARQALILILNDDWEVFIHMASENKDFFSVLPDKGIETIANLVWNKFGRNASMESTSSIPFFGEGRMVLALAASFRSGLCDIYVNIEKAAIVYKDFSLKVNGEMESILGSIMLNALENWNPTSPDDLMSLDSGVLESINQFRSEMKGSDIRIIARVSDMVSSVCSELNNEFKNRALPYASINFLCNQFSPDKWKALEELSGVALIDEEELKKYAVEIETCISSITDLSRLRANEIDYPIWKIFNRYGCSMNQKGISSFLIKWKNLHAVKVDNIKIPHSLAHLRRDVEAFELFRRRYKLELEIAQYMSNQDCMLFYWEIGNGDRSLISIETFLESIKLAQIKLLSLLKCNEDACARIKQAIEFLTKKKNSRDLMIESEMLMSCPGFAVSDAEVVQFRLIVSLISLASPVLSFVECCEQLQFDFVQSDLSFKELTQIASALQGDTNTFNMEDSNGLASKLINFLFCSNQKLSCQPALLQELIPFFSGFGYLSECSDVWIFVKEMKWVGSTGLRQFNEEFSNVTNKFLFAEYESNVLNAVEPVVRFISFIGELVGETSLKKFYDSTKACEELQTDKVKGLERNLQLVQENISDIREWFDSGFDDTSVVFNKFDQVWKSGQCSIRKNQLCLTYATAHSCETMFSSDLHDFVQQLGFIQQDHQLLSGQISSFLDQYEVLQDIVTKKVQAISIGYAASDALTFSHTMNQGLGGAKLLLDETIRMLEQCDSWLRDIHLCAPLSLLYWTEDLRIVYNAIVGLCNVSDENEMLNLLIPKLSLLIPRKILSDKREEMLKVVHQYIGGRETENIENHKWYKMVSDFLNIWHLNMAEPRYSEKRNKACATSGVYLHSFECQKERKALLMLCSLWSIYEGRAPESFEIIDGMLPCTVPKLMKFLARVRTFPTFTFIALNIQNMHSDLQEILVDFISNPEMAEKKLNFHCVQLSDTILHSSPWVEHIAWNEKKLQHGNLQEIKHCVVSGDAIESVTIILGERGSGKTRLIQNHVRQLGNESISVPIHEGTTIHSLLKSLKIINSYDTIGVSVHFSFMVELVGLDAELVESLNYFFNSLLLTRSVHDPVTGETFFMGWRKWHIFIELQGINVHGSSQIPNEVEKVLLSSIPILFYCSTFQIPSTEYTIDDKTMRVCTYLRAYENGTINRKFDSSPIKKQLIFVIDKSGSMAGSKMNVAIDNALKIYDSHVQIGDTFGTILFDSRTSVMIDLQEVTVNNKELIRRILDQCRTAGGGTTMYPALYRALADLRGLGNQYDSWIICLTDGETDNSNYQEFRHDLCASSHNLHLFVVGVNLSEKYRGHLQEMCHKFGSMETKGDFISSGSDIDSLNDAFGTVAARIPVSQTFQLDGALSDRDCWRLMDNFSPDYIAGSDMLLKKFWIEFLFRRVKVFDENEQFNYNETHDNLGSSLMSIMLCEARKLLASNHNQNWKDSNHEQLIYDFTKPDAPEFRLICTAPDLMTDESVERYQSLDLPGFFIPTSDQLKKRECLDSFLSQALNISLTVNEKGESRLSCVDNNRFVLTLDFTMKLLNIHERIACHIPCIIEGETGVSKTALTLMYSIMMNSGVVDNTKKSTSHTLSLIVQELSEQGYVQQLSSPNKSSYEIIRSAVLDATDGTMTRSTTIGTFLHEILFRCINERSTIFKDVPDEIKDCRNDDTAGILELLQWFLEAQLEKTFFELNVDASLEEGTIKAFFDDVCNTARKVASSGVLVVVFLDEINTSSVMGLFKEIVIDRSYCGRSLESNVAIVAACNPAGRQSLSSGLLRELDMAREWASGHYQVSQLHPTMACLKWNYGALNAEQEKEFVIKRIEMLDEDIPRYLAAELTEIITISQEAIRQFAFDDIRKSLHRIPCSTCNEEEIAARSRSSVSLRDIQRVFSLFSFFVNDFPLTKGKEQHQFRASMIHTIAVVYFFKLDSASRSRFLDNITEESTNPSREKDNFMSVLDRTLTILISETQIPDGIAITDGLKENIFMTLICSLSCTPLVIIGPPGSSKTLSVNIIDYNAKGDQSQKRFYRQLSKVDTFHYQCSRTSTSKEVSSVFEKAIDRQATVDSQKHKCLVFMDEAGLPEEAKESLKVLHYYLEGHMSAKANVGFVAITNHVLDAAKSNRCVSLLRQEPGHTEMAQIAEGVLYSTSSGSIEKVILEQKWIQKKKLAEMLCAAYRRVLTLREFEYETFYGLRDFIYFLRFVRQISQIQGMSMMISRGNIINALERNFNGIPSKEFQDIVRLFLEECGLHEESALYLFQKPIDVICSALLNEQVCGARYALIIDETDDDSIMRLLQTEGILSTSRKNLFKLSNMPENTQMEELSLVSRVKFAAQHSNTIVLSQTDAVNESFYDLFNQNFRRVTNRDGKECLYANIAVGGISRRSRVSESFRCVMHVREIDLSSLPAPFLNRFEKYKLCVTELLTCKLESHQFLSRIVGRAKGHIQEFLSFMTLCGYIPGQTLETLLLDLLQNAVDYRQQDDMFSSQFFSGKSFSDYFTFFAKNYVGLSISSAEFGSVVALGGRYLPISQAQALEELIRKNEVECPLNVVQSFKECLNIIPKPDGIIAIVIERLFEMLLTRKVILTLLDLASPEEIFKKRKGLPLDLVEKYFEQEHFALKPMLHSLESCSSSHTKQLKKVVVHTRSNAHIVGIPAVRPGENSSLKFARVEKYVHPKPKCVMIEHLTSLKNELALRSAIDTWCDDEDKEILLLIADMSDHVSTERVNYARCCVDQVSQAKAKIFVIILHYPASAFRAKKFYPALFLGNWNHTYLDSVGSDCLSADMKKLVEKTCRADTSKAPNIDGMAEKIMLDAIKSVASHDLIYPEQLPYHQSASTAAFQVKYSYLTSVLSINTGETTIGNFLKSQFIELWSEENLDRILCRAAWSLQNGTSQLGLTSCLTGILQEAMETFLIISFLQLNEWKNLDLCFHSNRSDETDNLFYIILTSLPVIPFEELLLHQVGTLHRCKELPNIKASLLQVHFPFFSKVSLMIDQVVESSLQKMSIENKKDAMMLSLSAAKLLNNTMKMLRATTDEKSIILKTLACVTSSETLYTCYFEQFLQWKLNCKTDSTIGKWFDGKLRTEENQMRLCSKGEKILLIHIIARKYDMELARLSSFRNELPLWVNQDENAETIDKSHVAYSLGGTIILDVATEWFTAHMAGLLEGRNTNLKWMEHFSTFRRIMPDILGNDTISSNRTAHILRLLFFFDALEANSVSQTSKTFCFERFYNFETSSYQTDPDTQLDCLVALINGMNESEEIKINCTNDLLNHFFSPAWLVSVEMSWKEDLNFVIKHLADTDFASTSKKLLFNLVRNACVYGATLDSKLGKNAQSNHCEDLKLSQSRLLVVNSLLCCDDISSFTKDGFRDKIPHFIPHFAQKEHIDLVMDMPDTSIPTNKAFGVFFSKYESSFQPGDKLAEAAYQIIMERIIATCSDLHSDKILLTLWKDIEIECNVRRKEQTRRCRTLFQGEEDTFAGSAISVLIIESKILCFLFRIAYEMATGVRVEALEGTNSNEARTLVERIMNIPRTRWPEIFILAIIKFGGEAKLLSLLSDTRSHLSKFQWTSGWKAGIPSMRDGVENEFRRAENEFREAEIEEQRKSQNMRLCPNCHKPFLVLQQNCGQFVCGRYDTHTTPMNLSHGCGTSFHLSQAGHYNIDTERLASLQEVLAKQRKTLEQHNSMSQVWKRMHQADLPYLSSCIERSGHFIPSSVATITLEKESKVFRHIAESRHKVEIFLMLPKLIELYMWLHSTFDTLISSEEASSIILGSLMSEDQLSKRFEPIQVEHLLLLWATTKESLNKHLHKCNSLVNWNCETLEIPFKNIEDASLLMLFSAFEHPTEGCDYLFILINQIIGQFNEFMRRLADIEKISANNCRSIDPKTLLFRSPTELCLRAFEFISSSNLSVLVENFRVPYKDEYNVTDLDMAISNGITGCHFTIDNPMSSLRTQFRFRQDSFLQNTDAHEMEGLKSSVNTYFVHHQDLQIFEKCQNLLQIQQLWHSDQNMKDVFLAQFHNLDYDDLRGVLYGMKTVLSTFTFPKEQTIDSIISEAGKLQELGFPTLSDSQFRLILSLKPDQISEFVQHIGYQLASEAYNFALLPLSMNSNISDTQRHHLQTKIDIIIQEKGKTYTLACLREFSEDVLSFYQHQIRDHCKSSNDSMKVFLAASNFADESDAIFAALPDSITVRNYIPLHQELHQLTLRLMSKGFSAKEMEETVTTEWNQAFAKPTRGNCWILHPDDTNYHMDDDANIDMDSTGDKSVSNTFDRVGNLWFESSIRYDMKDYVCPSHAYADLETDTKNENLQDGSNFAAGLNDMNEMIESSNGDKVSNPGSFSIEKEGYNSLSEHFYHNEDDFHGFECINDKNSVSAEHHNCSISDGTDHQNEEIYTGMCVDGASKNGSENLDKSSSIGGYSSHTSHCLCDTGGSRIIEDYDISEDSESFMTALHSKNMDDEDY